MLTTNQFSYSKKFNNFSAFASDLKGQDTMHQIYDDACDAGIKLKSGATGQVIRFAYDEEQTQRDEFEVFTYRIVPEDVRKFKHLDGAVIKIFNT